LSAPNSYFSWLKTSPEAPRRSRNAPKTPWMV
jgi:hypothetical protein